MKFNFEKLGGIDSGSVTLGDLTIICGPNNVGKTYISYAIYGLIRHFTRWIDLSISSEKLAELREQGTLHIDLKEYQSKLSHYLSKASSAFSEHLPQYFNVSDEFFKGAKAEFSHNDLEFNFSYEYKENINFGQLEQLNFYKLQGESVLSITFQTTNKSKVPNRILNDAISNTIADCLFSKLLPKPFVVTSERTGIALFYKELDISKNAIIEHISNTDKVDPFELLNSIRSRYAQPIHDNIQVVRDYETYSKRKSFIREHKEQYSHIIETLQELMGGSYKSINKQVMFIPKKERNREKIAVPVYVASSSIKSLFLIDLYINSLAEEKGMLIIDEPELNLHPDNQRKMAGLLARLVNAGIRILVTTHSDYLIRELNNRIMLQQEFNEKASIMKSAHLGAYDILKPEQVKAYSVGQDHCIRNISVDKYGMNVEIFDHLIAEANSLSERIYYALGDSGDD